MEKVDLQINRLVSDLQEATNDQEFDARFSLLYEKVNERWISDRVIQSISSRYNIPEQDVLSVALDKLYETCKTFYKKEFAYYHYLSRAISLGCANILKQRYREVTEEPTENLSAMEDDPTLVEFIPKSNNVDDFQKTSEQRQLLAQLLEKADDKCRQAVEAYSKSESFLEAAKLLGIDDKTVKRRVEKVAKHFNHAMYGDVYEYFTVPTEKAVSQRGRRKVS